MNTKIDISDVIIGGKAEILDNATIHSDGDNEIILKKLNIAGDAKILENLEVHSVLDTLTQQVKNMNKSSGEYPKIKQILETKNWKKDAFISCILKHLAEFSQGVVASVVANFLT